MLLKLVLAVFLFLYLSGYRTVSSTLVEELTQPEMKHVVRGAASEEKTPITPKPYLLQPPGEFNGNQLPGAVASEGKKFDASDEAKKEKKRDNNQLPGALGSEGAFDEHQTDMFGETSKGEGSSEGKGSKEVEEGGGDGNGDRKKVKGGKKKAKKKDTTHETEKESSDDSEKQSSGSAKEREDSDSEEGKKKSRRSEDAPKEDKEEEDAKEKDVDKDGEKNAKKGKGKDADNKKDDAKETKGNRKEKETGKEAKEDTTQAAGGLFSGPHPMNREMVELQVNGDGMDLTDDVVKEYYLKLAQAYLEPFKDGIARKSFFEILSRRTYGLAPPGSNKGIQTLLFQLHQKKLYLLDPYDIMKNSKPFYRTRIKELIWLLSELVKDQENNHIPDTEFLVAIHDCVQTVNQDHTYRGSVYKESNPTFTIVSCNFSDNIPFPMWEGDPVRGGLKSWDEKMAKYQSMDTVEWAKKEAKAVFRGGYRPSMYFKSKKEANDHCDHVGRSAIAYLSDTSPDLFNVGVSGMCGGKAYAMQHLSESDHHKFKYIMYAEGNCFWADRLNKQVFGPSLIIKQETPCGQFWEPLLKPMTHYLPTDFFFTDTVQQIQWAKENDDKVKGMIKNANDFASAFLSYKGIRTYAQSLLIEYTKLLKQSSITPEKGAREVTV